MSKFHIGDKVIKVDNSSKGTITNVKICRGKDIYTVVFDSNCTYDVLGSDLRADFDITDPFERCKSGIFGSYSDYSKKNTIFKIKNSNNSTISSLKASKTLFRSYQFKPLLKFLNSPNRRLLVADEVGLGKTIEAGHIMLELKARKELSNVLIVCPKSLQEKWKAELYEKFGLAFKIIEHTNDLIADLSSKNGNVKAIINYEKIRVSKNKSKNSKKTTNLIDFLTENPQQFSLILCDEAHKMRNRETQTYKGAEILMNSANAVLFLTATPIMISDENLYNLLHLLDNTRYFNYEIFRNRKNENIPFVKATTNLNANISLPDIYNQLSESIVHSSFSADDKEIFSKSTTIGEIYKFDPIFNEIQTLLQSNDTPKTRARLQYLFATMGMMNTIFSRTRKREVTTDMSQAERKPHIRKISLTQEEQIEFNQVISDYTDDNSYTDEWGEEKLTAGRALGLVQRKRQIASSIWAYLNNEKDLDNGIDVYSAFEDSKITELIKIIQTVFNNGTKKIVIFALFRKTLKYLNIRLRKAGFNSLIIHGLIDNRAEILQEFKNNSDIHILLSSEVGSEGLDMQFCNSMINYDLPWNPMVIEQRIGRIDRFGQKSPIVNIYNFVVANSIQEEIYMRLLDRIGIFRDTIGDMEAILDAQINIDNKPMTIQDVYTQMEKEFFTKKLTKYEIEKKISEVERAIANVKEELHHLQDGLSNTFTNDAYFKEEINRILHNNAYVTKEELYNFLSSVIRYHLTTCSIEEIAPNIMDFKIPLSDPKIIRNFLTQYSDYNDESIINTNHFKQQINGQNSFRFTFCQEVAYNTPSINYLNIYHPMIQACLNYFSQNEDPTNTSFCYGLKSDHLLQKGYKYYMGIYQLTSSKIVQGIKKENSQLIPLIFNLQTDQIETNQDIINHIVKNTQVKGIEHNATINEPNPNIVNDMNYDFTEYISLEIKNRLEEEQRHIESDRLRNEQQTIEYYKSRISNHENNIKTWEGYLEHYTDEKELRRWNGAIRLAKANINQLIQERDDRLTQINEDHQLNINNKLLSLSLITII